VVADWSERTFDIVAYRPDGTRRARLAMRVVSGGWAVAARNPARW
jgi:hypothetical protein